tara:strand:+ start:1606 stop:1755 length:150 start_codon:yes stop_codon:yes gene_type:complete
MTFMQIRNAIVAKMDKDILDIVSMPSFPHLELVEMVEKLVAIREAFMLR